MVGFKVGQKVVYPNHGIGTIELIEQKQIGATALPFYTLRLAATNTLVLVPVTNATEVGLRKPITTLECDTLFQTLSSDFATPAHDWKDRFKDFSEKMRTGNIFEVAEVLKHLNYLSHSKPLSFREQRMLERAHYLVVSELAAVCRQPECNIEPRVNDALAQACSRHDGKSNGSGNLRRAAAAGAH
jgi:CarD family transcriptional regulator